MKLWLAVAVGVGAIADGLRRGSGRVSAGFIALDGFASGDSFFGLFAVFCHPHRPGNLERAQGGPSRREEGVHPRCSPSCFVSWLVALLAPVPGGCSASAGTRTASNQHAIEHVYGR